MHSMISRRLGRVMLLLAGVAVVAIGGATYASAGASRTVNAAASSTPGSSPSAGASTPSASGSASAAAVATVATRTGPLGTYLVDGQGRSLYLFLADTGNTSHCSGACAEVWPPLVTSGPPQAGSGVAANKLGTTEPSGGVKQVTYNGHPLYRYSVDQNPGDTKGQGLNQFGALWWLVSPNGSAITSTSSSSGSAKPSGSSSPGSTGSPHGSPGY